VRQRFAAPIVLIIGCSSGSADRTTAPPPARHDAASAPAEAAAEVPPVDAAAALPVDPCKLPPSPDNPTCNPPAPRALEARVINTKPEGAGLELVVDKGSAAGIGPRWQAVLLTEGGQPIAGAALEIVSVSRNTTRMRLAKTAQLPSQRVRLSPP
jgi:hypothetical protein